jgi:hypothetical protein
MKKSLLILMLAGLSFSCSSIASLKTDNSPSATSANVDASSVKVFVTDKEVAPGYETLGEVVVAADAGSGPDGVVRKLRAMAADLGADTIINLRIEYEYGYWSIAMKATGTAVKTGD